MIILCSEHEVNVKRDDFIRGRVSSVQTKSFYLHLGRIKNHIQRNMPQLAMKSRGCKVGMCVLNGLQKRSSELHVPNYYFWPQASTVSLIPTNSQVPCLFNEYTVQFC